MKTEDLIADLVSRAAPVRPLPSPGIRVLEWSAVAIGSAVVAIGVFGWRADFGVTLTQPEFMFTALLALATAALAAGACLVLAVPAAERSPALRASTVILAALWAIVLVTGVVREGHGFAGAADWPTCFRRVIAIGLVPAIVLFSMLRRGAPLRFSWTSALAMIAAMSTGAIAIQFICAQHDPGHLLLGHFGPVLAIGWLGALAGRPLLKQDNARLKA